LSEYAQGPWRPLLRQLDDRFHETHPIGYHHSSLVNLACRSYFLVIRSWSAYDSNHGRAFPWFESISGGLSEPVGPCVDDRMAIDISMPAMMRSLSSCLDATRCDARRCGWSSKASSRSRHRCPISSRRSRRRGCSPASMRPAKRRISLHDLLTHTAGFVHRLWDSDPAASRVTIGVGTQPIRGARAGVHEHAVIDELSKA
jgi:hypothetical protein